jgi:CubicO group peptidase (beta-lactamase class C family)
LFRDAYGALTYAAGAAAASLDTIFDLASLTKVIATGPLVMQAIDERRIALDDRLADYLPLWRGADREHVTIADVLEHAAGLTAYLPFFRDHQGREEFERAICTLPLEYTPRTQSIYSDLGFMLLGFLLEDVKAAPLRAQFERLSTSLMGGFRLQAEGTSDLLSFDVPRHCHARTAPTELDLWRGRLLQAEVHDENAWRLGGAAGHAGVFGTAGAVGAFARAVLQGLMGGVSFASADTLQRFTMKSRVPGSSRALAWDTMLTTSSCGTRMSPRAIGHTGFTGASLWIDPARDLYIVLLTNRVHPTRENNQLQPFRRELHDAIVDWADA